MHFLFVLLLAATPFAAPSAADTSAAAGRQHAVAAAPPIAPAGAAADAAQAPPAEAPALDDLRLRFSGQIFSRYGWNYSGTGAERDFNSFSVDRFYLTVRGALSERIRFRGTTDVKQADAAAGLGSVVVLKYAYVDWDVLPWLTLQTGIVPTGWANHVNKVWGYRALAKGMGQYEGYFTTADMGAAASVALPAGLGRAALHVLNGNGFRKPEVDRFKDVAAHVVLTPFAGTPSSLLQRLQVGGHTYRARTTEDAARTVWGAMAAYAGPRLTAGVNYERQDAGGVASRGLSAFGRVDVAAFVPLPGAALVGRVDRFDGADTGHLRTIFGVAVRPAPALTLVLDHQHVTGDEAAFARYDGTFSRSDGRLYLHAIVKY